MKQNKGITLIALVVTIIVLIILAGTTISMLNGEKGIIKQAIQAKEKTEIASEKEILEQSIVQAIWENKQGKLEKNELENSLNNNVGEGKTEVIKDDEGLVVKFIEKDRYYNINSKNTIEKMDLVTDKNAGNIEVGINGENLNGREEPFEIWCIEDLIEWSNNYSIYQDCNIKLCKTLNFKSIFSYENSDSLEYGDINKDGKIESIMNEMQTGIGFAPIFMFEGTFDGNKKQIKNIYINAEEYAGLIRWTENDCEIKDLSITGKILSNNGSAGGIVGVRNIGNLTMKNCYNKSEVKGNIYAGGIIGEHNIYEGCLELINCYNDGKIESINQSVGGIVGICSSDTLIKNCYNKGNIITEGTGGGVIGTANSMNNEIKLFNCYNEGEILGDMASGGIVGGTSKVVKIYNSYNIGKIICNGDDLNYSAAGGIIGFNNATLQVENCYNAGMITANKKKGAIIGTTYSPIDYCYYLDTSIENYSNDEIIAYDKTYMQSIDFVNELNNNIIEIEGNEEFSKWIYKENAFPQLDI